MRPRTKDIFVCSTVNFNISIKVYNKTYPNKRKQILDEVKKGNVYYNIFDNEVILPDMKSVRKALQHNLKIHIK